MLDSCQNAQERWGGVHKLIDSWLKARHELVRAFDALGEKPEALAENHKLLQEFCSVLVDYVSAGHFGVYEQLTKEAEAFDDQRGLDLAETIYPRIDVITESSWRLTTFATRASALPRNSKSWVPCSMSVSSWKTA